MRVGGQSPDAYGLSLTVKVPSASATSPVETNTPLIWASGSYNAAVAPAGSAFDMVAKHPVEDATTPLGVWLASGGARIQVMRYSGTAPTVGGSVVADGLGGVTTAGVDGGGAPISNNTRVLYVDTVRSYCEVLI